MSQEPPYRTCICEWLAVFPQKDVAERRSSAFPSVALGRLPSLEDGATPIAPRVRDRKTGTIYATATCGGHDYDGTTVKFQEKKLQRTRVATLRRPLIRMTE